MPFNVLILGAGQIAAGYDSPDSTEILTHAHAIIKHPDFNLLGFYDTNPLRAEEAALKWGVKTYDEPIKADVIVICTPDVYHLNSIHQAIALNPRFIVLEKPIADCFTNAEKIINVTKGLPVQINFTRRFVNEFQTLASSIKNYGSFITGTGLYGKGFIHNGSHMIDLLRLLLGEIKEIETLDEINDFFPDDGTKTAIIRLEQGGEFFIRGVNCNYYTIFELDLCFEKARVKILDSGWNIQIYETIQSEKYTGYINLSLKESIHTEMGNAMYNLYQNVFDNLTYRTQLLSAIEDTFTKVIYTE